MLVPVRLIARALRRVAVRPGGGHHDERRFHALVPNSSPGPAHAPPFGVAGALCCIVDAKHDGCRPHLRRGVLRSAVSALGPPVKKAVTEAIGVNPSPGRGPSLGTATGARQLMLGPRATLAGPLSSRMQPIPEVGRYCSHSRSRSRQSASDLDVTLCPSCALQWQRNEERERRVGGSVVMLLS
jgi:hypothetical protein